MTTKDYKIIAEAIWRAGFIEDKNKIKQKAKEDMRRLIMNNLIGSFKEENPRFNEKKFIKAIYP